MPGEKRLVAYVMRRERRQRWSVEELRAHLKAVLPEYMVPSAFVMLESLPLTPNGKLDRRACRPRSWVRMRAASTRRRKGRWRRFWRGIWQELLRVERVGRQRQLLRAGRSLAADRADDGAAAAGGLSAEVRAGV